MDQQNKWVSMHSRMHRIFDRMNRGEQVLSDGKPVGIAWLSGVHKYAVDHFFTEGLKHTMVDSLDRTLPKYMADRSVQRNVLWCDLFSKEKNILLRALTTKPANILTPRDIHANIAWAFYVSPPHGQLIWSGDKTTIIKSMIFKHHLSEPLLLVSGSHAYGVISLGAAVKITQGDFNAQRHRHKIGKRETIKLGFDKQKDIYSYDVNVLHAYPCPVLVEKPAGMQTFARTSEIRVVNDQPEFSVDYSPREMDNIFFGDDRLVAAFGF